MRVSNQASKASGANGVCIAIGIKGAKTIRDSHGFRDTRAATQTIRDRPRLPGLEAYAVAARWGRSTSALFRIPEIRILTRTAYHPYHPSHHSYFKNKEYGKSQQ